MQPAPDDVRRFRPEKRDVYQPAGMTSHAGFLLDIATHVAHLPDPLVTTADVDRCPGEDGSMNLMNNAARSA